MTSTFHKFNSFVGDVGTKKINLNSDTLKILFTNTAPDVADTVVDTTGGVCVVKGTSNANEVAAASGYSKGGAQVASNAYSQTDGTGKLTGSKVTVTAGAAIGPFQYAVLYDASSGAAATRSVIGWWDYGVSITLNPGEPFIIGNSNDDTDWTSTYPILTLA